MIHSIPCQEGIKLAGVEFKTDATIWEPAPAAMMGIGLSDLEILMPSQSDGLLFNRD